MKFNIPKQQKPLKERIDVKLEQALLQKLDRYCQYLESDRDYVIGTVLADRVQEGQGLCRMAEVARSAGCGGRAFAPPGRRVRRFDGP